MSTLLQRIDGKAAEQFGKEVGGFLGHDGAGKGDFAELFHGDGVGEESDVSFAAAHLVDGFGGIAQVAQVGLFADFFGIEAKQAVEDDGVQMAQDRAGADFREARQRGRGGGRAWSAGARRRCG